MQQTLTLDAPAGWALRAEDQQPLVDRAIDAIKFAPRGRLLIQAETGAGKTVMASVIAADAARAGRTVAWMAHRRELLDQAADALTREGISTDRWPHAQPQPGRVLLVMAQGTGTPTGVDDLIVDEAHHSLAPSWHAKIDDIAAARTWGWTATPMRTAPHEGLDAVWDHMICGPTYRELVDIEALAPYQVVTPDDGARIVRSRLAVDEFGEFTARSVSVEVTRLLATGAATRQWTRAAREAQQHSNGDLRTIWFVPGVAAAHETADELRDAGMTAEVLTGTARRAERRDVIARFRSGDLLHLVTVDIATEGLDVPECGIVVHLRSTSSFTLHRQMNGRGLRWAPHKTTIIVDMAGNIETHGVPDMPIRWRLEPRGDRTWGPPITSECPVCAHTDPTADPPHRNHTSRATCSRCGHRLQFTCGTCHRRQHWTRYAASADHHGWTQAHDGAECGECTEAARPDHAADWTDMLTVDHNGQVMVKW